MPMTMPMLAAALALQLLPAPDAIAWEPVSNEADGATAINPASISRDGDIATFLIRVDTSTPQPDGSARFVMRAHINCRAGTLAFQTADSYGPGGAFLRSRNMAPEALRFRPLDSSGQRAMRRRVCR